jgi:glycosyltransferase involved in cell wall biosynthesis
MTSGTVSVVAVGALGEQAPSFRVRTQVPSAELGRHGVAMRHLPLFTAQQDRLFHEAGAARRLDVLLAARKRLRQQLAAGGDWDVTLIQRQVDLLPGLGLERRAVGERRLVLDVDDAIWLDHRSAEARGHRLAMLKGTARKVRWLASRADLVIAGNDLLAEWLGRYSRHVAVVPSVVEHREIRPRIHEPRDRLVVGWIGSASTAPLLDRMVQPLRRLGSASRGVGIDFLVVGGRAPVIPGLRVRSERWSEERERAFLRQVDIGVMPLEDSEWARGKCSYKALQYMAAGIPVVADDVGVSARVIGHEVGGLVARDADQWVDHLVALAHDPHLRARLGAAGRVRVRNDFSVERWAPRLASLLRGAGGAGA